MARNGKGTTRILLGALAFTLAGAAMAPSARAEQPAERPGRNAVRSQLRRASRFAAPGVAASDAFQVRYSLPRDADLSVTLLDLQRMPLRTFHLIKGQAGTLAGENALTIWDGKDSKGRDVPAGEYWAALSFQDAAGAVETKRFRLVKP